MQAEEALEGGDGAHEHSRERGSEDDARDRGEHAARSPRRGKRDTGPEHALAVIEALRDGPLAIAERGARLFAADPRPEAIRTFDVGERERQRAPERTRRNGAHKDEIAHARHPRVPAHERVAYGAALDRAPHRAAPRDDVPVGDDVL